MSIFNLCHDKKINYWGKYCSAYFNVWILYVCLSILFSIFVRDNAQQGDSLNEKSSSHFHPRQLHITIQYKCTDPQCVVCCDSFADIGTVMKVVSVPRGSWHDLEEVLLEEMTVFRVGHPPGTPPCSSPASIRLYILCCNHFVFLLSHCSFTPGAHGHNSNGAFYKAGNGAIEN